jgi:rRNA maturation endonuclease Nob1
MIECPSCGKDIPADSKVCPSCGEDVNPFWHN